MIWYNTTGNDTIWYNMIQYNTIQHDTTQRMWHDMIWYRATGYDKISIRKATIWYMTNFVLNSWNHYFGNEYLLTNQKPEFSQHRAVNNVSKPKNWTFLYTYFNKCIRKRRRHAQGLTFRKPTVSDRKLLAMCEHSISKHLHSTVLEMLCESVMLLFPNCIPWCTLRKYHVVISRRLQREERRERKNIKNTIHWFSHQATK